MASESGIDETMVRNAMDKVGGLLADRRNPPFMEGEFRYRVFETLVAEAGIPFVNDEGLGLIPDFNDPRVREISELLIKRFEELLD